MPPVARKRPAKKSTTTEKPAAKKEKRDDAPFYCPGCGRRFQSQRECRGMSETAPHQPIETVSTAELDGDPEKHTAAPASGEERAAD